MLWRRFITLSMFVFSLCWPGLALADGRVALLIGNSHYQHVGTLANPWNDVAAMAMTLRGAGFSTVHTDTDLGHDAMIRALRTFEDEAATADIAVIYYSGHGLEMSGTNYLVPVDAKLVSNRDVEDEAVTLDRMLRAISGAKRLKLVILDACRDNPFLSTISRADATRAIERGLARTEPNTVNTLIAYSAAAGTVASDGDDIHSPFTASLVRHIGEPGKDIRLVLGEVRDDVMKTTDSRQQPFVNGSLGGDVLALADASTQPSVPPSPEALSSEAADLWPIMQKITDTAALQAFKTRYADTQFAPLAGVRLEQLSAPAMPSANQKTAAIVPPPSAAMAVVPVTDCDRLAARPTDKDSMAPGVDFKRINVPVARAACERAAQQYPGEARFANLLGRVLSAANKYDEAVEWYRKAADAGNGHAMDGLGVCYYDGDGVTQDHTEAIRWFRKAVENGEVQGLAHLAMAYDDGNGVQKSPVEAARYAFAALEQGSAYQLDELVNQPQIWTSQFRGEMLRKLRERGLYKGPISTSFNAEAKAGFKKLTGL